MNPMLLLALVLISFTFGFWITWNFREQLARPRIRLWYWLLIGVVIVALGLGLAALTRWVFLAPVWLLAMIAGALVADRMFVRKPKRTVAELMGEDERKLGIAYTGEGSEEAPDDAAFVAQMVGAEPAVRTGGSDES